MLVIDSKRKIWMAFAGLTLLLMTVLAAFYWRQYQPMTLRYARQYVELRRQTFFTNLQSAGLQLQNAAGMIARNDQVKLFFEHSAVDTLTAAHPLIQRFSQQWGASYGGFELRPPAEFEMQLFAQPATSIYKSWDLATGEDFSLLRKSVLHVNAYQRPAWALELDASGLRVRGLAPVSSVDGKLHLGTLELFSSIEQLLLQQSNDHEHWALFVLDRHHRIIHNQQRESAADFLRLGRFVFLHGQALAFDASLFDEAEFEQVLAYEPDQMLVNQKGGLWNIAFPVRDFADNPIGIMAIQISPQRLATYIPPNRMRMLAVVAPVVLVLSLLVAQWAGASRSARGVQLPFLRVFWAFPEFRRYVRAFQRNALYNKQLHSSLETFFDADTPPHLPPNHPSGPAWAAFVAGYAKHQQTVAQMSDMLQFKDWLNEANLHISLVLNKDYPSLDQLLDALLREYMQRLGAVGGAIYWADNHRKVLVRLSAQLGGRRSTHYHEIAFGDGLVGSVAIERKRTLIDRVPANYFQILSGLGKSAPKQILIEPFVARGQLVALVELASFDTFVERQLQLLSLSAELVSARIGMFDASLRASQFDNKNAEQSNVLNMKELAISNLRQELWQAQQTGERIKNQYQQLHHFLKNTTLYMVFDPQGRVTEVSDAWAKALGLPPDEILGTSFYDGMEFDNFEGQDLQAFWDSLADGQLHRRISTYRLADGTWQVHEAYLAQLDGTNVRSVWKLAASL